jgi:hypothetical protein
MLSLDILDITLYCHWTYWKSSHIAIGNYLKLPLGTILFCHWTSPQIATWHHLKLPLDITFTPDGFTARQISISKHDIRFPFFHQLYKDFAKRSGIFR